MDGSCRRRMVCLAITWSLAAFMALDRTSSARAGEAADSGTLYQPATAEAGQQVQRIVLAQLKAFVPETAPFAASVAQGRTLDATVGGERYQGVAYRAFSFTGTGPDALTARRFYVKTTAPWKLPDGTEIPAGTSIAFEDGKFAAPKDAAQAKTDNPAATETTPATGAGPAAEGVKSAAMRASSELLKQYVQKSDAERTALIEREKTTVRTWTAELDKKIAALEPKVADGIKKFGPPKGGGVTKTFERNPDGAITRVTDTDGGETIVEHDAAGRVSRVTKVDSGAAQFEADARLLESLKQRKQTLPEMLKKRVAELSQNADARVARLKAVFEGHGKTLAAAAEYDAEALKKDYERAFAGGKP